MSDTIVCFFLTSLYLRRILWRIRIVFARPHENTKTMEIRCKASSFSKKPPFRPFTRKRQAGVLKNSTLGTVFIPRKYRLRVSGKLNGNKKSLTFQKYPVTCGLGHKVSLWSLCSVWYKQHLWPDLLLYLNMKLILFLSFALYRSVLPEIVRK